MNNYQTIILEVKNSVATIQLNRPEAMNAISQKMRMELLDAINEIESNDSIKIAVLSANGRGFSAGGDLLEGLAGHSTVEDKILAEYIPIFNSIENSSKLFISAIHGACTGIASGVALVSDLAVMSEEAYLYIPFARLNLVPDGGVSYQLVRHLGYKRAMEVYVSGGKIPANQCLAYGLVNRVVPKDELASEVQKWAETLAEGLPLAHKLGKQCLQHALHNELTDVVAYEAKQQVTCSQDPTTIATLKSLFSKEKLIKAGHEPA